MVHEKSNESTRAVITSFLLGFSVKSFLNQLRLPEPARKIVDVVVALATARNLILLYRRSHMAEEVPELKKENDRNRETLLALEAEIQANRVVIQQGNKTIDHLNSQLLQSQQNAIVDSRGVTRQRSQTAASIVQQTLFARPPPEARTPLTIPATVLN